MSVAHDLGASSLRDRAVLVTGGAGFIGTHLVNHLDGLGARVTVVDDFSGTSSRAPNRAAHVHRLRLPDAAFGRLVEDSGFAVIFHLAGAAYVPPSIDDPLDDLSQNAAVTLHVLEVARRVAPGVPVIYTSSAAVYGSPKRLPITETTPTVPVSPYGVSKFAAEQYLALYARVFGLRGASLRLFSVFGPGQRKQVVYDLMAKLRTDQGTLFVHGTGDETRDLVYVGDVVQSLLLVLDRAPLRGECYNVAGGAAVSVREIAAEVARQLGVAPRMEFSGVVRPGDAMHWLADVSRVRGLGFTPSVGLTEGVRRIRQWVEAEEAVDHIPLVRR